MIDPNRGKYQKWFRQEFKMAGIILQEFGGKEYADALTWADADYQAFRFRCDGVSLVFYPHTTRGTGNVSCRVRDDGSKDKKKMLTILSLLHAGTGYNNTFYCKAHNDWSRDDKVLRSRGLAPGWAMEAAR